MAVGGRQHALDARTDDHDGRRHAAPGRRLVLHRRTLVNQTQPNPARDAFEKARAQGIPHTIKHIAAGLELQRLGAGP